MKYGWNKDKKRCDKCRKLFPKEEIKYRHSGMHKGKFCRKCYEVEIV